jgi:hypothetical protein
MSSDMYYYNLTVDTNTTLNTGGYRLFVKNILSMGANAVIGLPGGSAATGTLKGGGVAGASTTNSLGGNAVSATATPPTAANGGIAYYQYPSQAVRGYSVTAASGAPQYVQGGAGGVGAGGGVVIVAARYVSTTAACTISSTGGTDAGGGAIIFISTDDEASFNTKTDLSLDVSGDGSGASGTAIYLEVV